VGDHVSVEFGRNRIVRKGVSAMTDTPKKIAFASGSIYMTPGAEEVLEGKQHVLLELLRRHLSCDWGDLGDEDKRANDRAVAHGDRILSSYRTESGEMLWVITESSREYTTVLTPGEY
jgi:hypothetical protein